MMEVDADGEPPDLNGTPYQRHVYIASCPQDAEIRNVIATGLESQGLFAYTDDEKLSTEKNIELGIDKSRKVMFLATKSYLAECDRSHRQMQANLAKDKACYISPEVVIIVTWPNVDTQLIKSEIGDYKTHIYTGPGDENSFKLLRSLIANEPQKIPEVRQFMGATMAYCQYFGYLRIILPGLRQRIIDSQYMKGIHNPNDRNMSKKFFIIVPESLRCPPSLNCLDRRITDIGKIEYKRGRGGNCERDYSSFVHKITNEGLNEPKEYLFVGDIPNILINLYDMHQSGIDISQSKKNLEVRQFFYYLQHLINEDPSCRGQVSFIYHADESATNYQQAGDLILAVIKDEIMADLAMERNPQASFEDQRAPMDLETVGQVNTGPLKVEYLPNPLKYYPMNQNSVGMVGQALIINNRNFDFATRMEPRRGAEKDEQSMIQLMDRLKFNVTTYRDQTKAQMLNLITHYANEEMHTNAQAFCCVIMTHGKCGQLYSRDGQLINFVDLAEITGKCRALQHKPKLFFVEACQSFEPCHQQGDGNAVDERQRLTPSASDMIASFSTLPGQSAYRDTLTGTLYIQSLCSLIEQRANGMDLEQILKLVASDVETKLHKSMPNAAHCITPKQLPFCISTAKKRIALCLTEEKETR